MASFDLSDSVRLGVMLVRVISPEELATLVNDVPPAREDEVTLLADGTCLDTSEKLLAYINEQQIRDGLPQIEALVTGMSPVEWWGFG